VASGSRFDGYFLHIEKKIPSKQKAKNIILIGKAITFDAGGLNIKLNEMHLMKTDMTGSAIILNVLNLLEKTQKDHHNIHLLIPIAENMCGPNAVRPGMVIRSLNGVTVEITNTDAEGRLCMADALEYFTKFMKPKLKTSLILDISTLTGNVCRITSVGGALMGNSKATKYKDRLMRIGESIGEYMDYIELRDEYKQYLDSTVAEINNYNPQCTAGTSFAGIFLKHFTDDNIPYLHLDLGCGTFDNNKINSFGIHLLYRFLSK
jgi:leucyl aminopeptidase